MLSILKKYATSFWILSFKEKHEILNTWMTLLIAVGSIVLSALAFYVTARLQADANSLQREVFIVEEHKRNRVQTEDALKAFALDPAFSGKSQRNCKSDD